MLNKLDSKTLGHKNSIPLEPYLKWVRTRTQNLMMPYPSILPVIIEPVIEGDVPYTILHPDMPTSLEDQQRGWIQLMGERDTFEAQFYASEKKVLELTRLLHEEKTLNAYIARGCPTLFSHSHNEKKRCPYVLHSSLGMMVYFASSLICIKERTRFKVATKVDDA